MKDCELCAGGWGVLRPGQVIRVCEEHLIYTVREVDGEDVAWVWVQVGVAAVCAAFDRVLSEEFSQDLETWYTDAPGVNLLRDIEGEACGCGHERGEY